jgi:transcriptional regulator with XRE-family HTH domain
MTTRIREIRKLKGLTLQELGERVSTTAQTIQRLETDNMTVSLDWLIRIADALGVSPSSLLAGRAGNGVRYVGDLKRDGVVVPIAEDTPASFFGIDVPGENPLAVKLVEQLGPHEAGTILVVEKLADDDHDQADGRDCLVMLSNGSLLFRRIVNGKGRPAAFVPYTDRPGVERDLDIDWLAPVTMLVRYMPPAK